MERESFKSRYGDIPTLVSANHALRSFLCGDPKIDLTGVREEFKAAGKLWIKVHGSTEATRWPEIDTTLFAIGLNPETYDELANQDPLETLCTLYPTRFPELEDRFRDIQYCIQQQLTRRTPNQT